MNLWSFTPRIFEACERVHASERGELELQSAVTIAMREMGERFRVIPARAAVLDLSTRGDIAEVADRLSDVEPRP
jgi:glucose-1-phosphate thymidylyltransferase